MATKPAPMTVFSFFEGIGKVESSEGIASRKTAIHEAGHCLVGKKTTM